MINRYKKGKLGELETVQFFKRWWPDAARSIGQSRRGSEAPDIINTPFWVESKLVASVTQGKVAKWWKTAVEDVRINGEYDIKDIIIRYRCTGLSKPGPNGFTYVRFVLHERFLTELELNAGYSDRTKVKYFSFVGPFIEITEDYFRDLLDYNYKIRETINGVLEPMAAPSPIH